MPSDMRKYVDVMEKSRRNYECVEEISMFSAACTLQIVAKERSPVSWTW